MIITRTPFRISFFGGGTDYPDWYRYNNGAVLSTSIDKYCYISCRLLPPFFDYRYRIIYSQREEVNKVSEITHPSVRETLNFLQEKRGLHIHHDGDLPARTGLGSSSAFTVGLLNALYAMKGIMPTKERLAKEAIYVEQEMCRDNVGCQDQTLAAYGGFNFIEFGGNNHLQVRSIIIPANTLQGLQRQLMLYFTGFSRNASEIARHQIDNIPQKQFELTTMYDMAFQALDILKKGDLEKFGKLMYESWKIKRELSTKISTSHIDALYDAAMRAGAIGGKLLGAGGGGFVLFFVPLAKQKAVKEKLKKLLLVPFEFENLGSQIIFYQPNGK